MQLTTEVLTQMLGRPVRSFVKEPLGLFSSNVSRITVTCEDAPAVSSFVCKEPHPNRNDRAGESFAIEAQFYEQLAPRLPIRVPTCYAHAEDFILLEDVDTLPFSWQTGATEQHMLTALNALRALHRTRVDAADDWVPAFADPTFRASLQTRFAASWTSNRDALCQWCPEFAPIGDLLQTRMTDHYAALATPGVLLHGDAHLENIPLRADSGGSDTVVFFDWQGPRRGHPLFDVAYFNVMSLPGDIRRTREPGLLGHYLGKAPSAAEQMAYRHGVAARASGIVEMTVDWPRNQLDQAAFGWVAKRCFSAALDHRVGELFS